MRDYTRKAKIKDSNEWAIGYHVYVDYLDKHYILVSEKIHDGFRGMSAMKQYEVDGDTICNPTGLTDQNGNKIWENDIVHLFGKDTIRNYDWKAVVEFGNPNSLYSWGYQLKPIGHFEYNEDILCWVGMEEANIYCETIGNIFDNPELLKGE